MDIDKKTKYGTINISLDAIATVTGKAATECYGVVGMASKNSHRDVLKKENYANSVFVHKLAKGQVGIDIYIIVGYGLRITEIVSNVQTKVKYDLEKVFNITFSKINVYVQDVK